MDGGSLLHVGLPTEHQRRPTRTDRARALMPGSTKIAEVSQGLCKVVYVTQLNLGGYLPKWASNHYMRLSMIVTSRMQRHFQGLRVLEDWDGEDGKAIAEFMLMTVKEEKNQKKEETRENERETGVSRESQE